MTTSATTAKSLIASLLLAGLVAFTIGHLQESGAASDVTSATVANAERSGTLLALTPLF